ncbi:MAG: tetratricopeptide repeat protein [Tannerellaceae bacterium]|jgi:tetratricopeptide (TPR) repeat protein|nr:tetratricopeptide repeat protein [Tannerellaceae bacterium]
MNTRLIYRLLVLVIIFTSVQVRAQELQLKEAEAAYAQADYTKAIDAYRSVLQTYGESAEVYYNLANASYKNNEIASAILYYERALLIDPGDTDISFNLELARQRTVDRITPIGGFFLTQWLNKLQNMGAADSWAWLGIGAFLLFIACLFVYFFSRQIILKKTGFYLGIFFLIIIIFTNIFAGNQKNELTQHNKAIIFSPTVTVKSSPNPSGTDLFILHEGTKVAIRNTISEWNEIELEDGNIGWMLAKDMELI